MTSDCDVKSVGGERKANISLNEIAQGVKPGDRLSLSTC